MAAVQATTLKRALATFECEINGVPVTVHAGDVVTDGHPIMKGREELFGPLKIHFTGKSLDRR